MLADDLTGAADAGVQLTRAGYRAAVVFRGAPVPEGLDAAIVDTDSRPLPPEEARERVLEAGPVLRTAEISYKKIDSTLRGPLAAELAAALCASGRPRAVVAPAFPGNGRTTRDGVQLLRGEPVDRTEPARDPRTPARESRIPVLLSELGEVATLSVRDLEDPGRVRRALSGAAWIVADAEEDGHLEALVRCVPDPGSVLWVGSAGLALALGEVYPGPGKEVSERPDPARNALAVVGSLSSVSREQLRRLAAEPWVVPVPLGAGASGELRTALRAGKSAALHSPEEAGDPERTAAALAEVVAGLSGEGLFGALVLTGGETAVRVARKLGADGILLCGELEPGVPVGRLAGPAPYPVFTKAGGFGSPDTLRNALCFLTGKDQD
jgi:uncharacterized protein YgbK (DUF1537 family)